VREPEKPELSALRRTRYFGLRAVAQLRGVPGRHGSATDTGPHNRPHRQRRRLRARKLSLGDQDGASQQHIHELACRIRGRDADVGGMVSPDWA